jgi:hypothetical protein
MFRQSALLYLFEYWFVPELRANYLLSGQFQNYLKYYTKMDYSFSSTDSELTLCLKLRLGVQLLIEWV